MTRNDTSERATSQDEENKGVDTKYTVPDGHWDEKDVEEENPAHPTQYIDSHLVSIICNNKRDPEDNYDRTKWEATVTYRDGEPSVLYFTSYRWKGNYWRDIMDVDWRDAPDVVKRRVASVVACDGVDDLDPEVRLIEQEGRSRWKEIHMPRLEAMQEGNDDE